MVRLEKITEDNYRACFALKVAENQTNFVSSNILSLAKAYVFYDIVLPFAIYNDKKYQSKGYGKQAMKLAIEWMKKDDRCQEIVTTYKIGNEHAKKLYTQLGFHQMGEVEDGEIDMVLRF